MDFPSFTCVRCLKKLFELSISLEFLITLIHVTGIANGGIGPFIALSIFGHFTLFAKIACCGRPWPASYINFNQNTHQIQVSTKPLCRDQAIFYSLPNNEWGTKYRGLTYRAK